MLLTEHSTKSYSRPRFAKAVKRSKQQNAVLDAFNKVWEQNPSLDNWNAYDAAFMDLDDFLSKFEDIRDDLAYRSLLGESLTSREELTLHQLNKRLDELVRPPETTDSRHFGEALREAKRILSLHKK